MSKLYFRYGAMNCGKTTALLQVAHNYEERGQNVLIMKPALDKKGNDEIVSRLGISRKVDILLDETMHPIFMIQEILDKNIHCILVDEAQFLKREQVDELYTITKLFDIPVISYGLRTSSEMELFEGSERLLAIADRLEELVTICRCGHRATINVRLDRNGNIVFGGQEQVAIDGIDANYESYCGKCHIEQVRGMTKEKILDYVKKK
ncbi:MAG: thymidine kinase [Firmicutes bacterium]|nr:thymidine kinase [Bacillota bacterium]